MTSVTLGFMDQLTPTGLPAATGVGLAEIASGESRSTHCSRRTVSPASFRASRTSSVLSPAYRSTLPEASFSVVAVRNSVGPYFTRMSSDVRSLVDRVAVAGDPGDATELGRWKSRISGGFTARTCFFCEVRAPVYDQATSS